MYSRYDQRTHFTAGKQNTADMHRIDRNLRQVSKQNLQQVSITKFTVGKKNTINSIYIGQREDVF